MKASKMLISTQKEASKDAKIQSHILLVRSGMIKPLVAGVYNFLPLGLRVLKKIENIIREEMDESGALEILSSAMQPKELWEESHRWSKYGSELFRFTDRHEREFCLGPTHEEVFTDLARNIIKSSKSLPVNLYQIQTKYRDEARPRFGLMRGREFIMKDAYSFDKDNEGLEQSYNLMYDTYTKIFDRLKLNYKAVLADTGAIGGNGSHQFMALSEVGESDIVSCDSCLYAADVEKAIAVATNTDDSEFKDIIKVSTPNTKTIAEVSKFFNVSESSICKTLIYKDTFNNKLYAAIIRGDRELNIIKLVNAANTSEAFLEMASDKDILDINSCVGYVGPIGLDIEVFVDSEVANMKNFIVGANEASYHYQNVNFNRDFSGTVIDLRNTVEGDKCPMCGATLHIDRGIEVGQIFKLQTTYSNLMKCTYTDEFGKNIPMSMGCYGIGVTRCMAAVVEQYNDESGMKWPIELAPYHACIVPVKYEDEAQKQLSDKMYETLKKQKVEVILDDRKAGLGFKLKDFELIGIPYIIIVGKQASENIVEVVNRATLEKTQMNYEDALKLVFNAVYNS